MRAVLQVVSSAKVEVDDLEVGRCGKGFMALIGVHKDDEVADAATLVQKLKGLRVFPDTEGKMNLSLQDLPDSGEPNLLLVSNFTLYGDVSSGRRPSFTKSAGFDKGKELFENVVRLANESGLRTETGVFGAQMRIRINNEGPITLIVDTRF